MLHTGRAMYAAIIQLTIDPTQAAAAAAAFTNDILPRIRNAQGFVSGYWADPVDGEGFGFVLFESEKEARSATPPAADWSAPGVTISQVNIRRVAVAIQS